jgi:hypothetical protein
MLILLVLLIPGRIVNADSWGEPIRSESVKTTHKTRKIQLKNRSEVTRTVKGKKKTAVTSSINVTGDRKVITTKKTVTCSIKKFKKGSKTEKVTTVSTVTTTKETYQYYYSISVGVKQSDSKNISMNLDRLKQYLPDRLVSLLKAEGVQIYLYSDQPIFEKAGVVGVAEWNDQTKAAYAKRDRWYVILHEVGHLFDCYAQENTGAARKYSSESAYFQRVFQKERKLGAQQYQSSICEYFAEAFMYYYLRPTRLKSERPETWKAMQLFVNSLS